MPSDSIIGEIIIDNTLNIDAHSNKDTICLGDSIELNVSGANYYLWSTGDTASNLILYPPSSTTYLVTGTDMMVVRYSFYINMLMIYLM